MTDKINLTGPADLLATIAHMLGMTPTESFVILTADGGRLGATVRTNAPFDVDPTSYAQTLASFAANDANATAAYVVVYSDEDPDGYPYAGHVAALVNEMATARMPVRDVWLVTSTHWTQFGSDVRHPLDEIRDSNANASFVYRGSAPTVDVYNPELLGTWVPRVEAPEGTEDDCVAACTSWAGALEGTGTPDAGTMRELAAAFQHKMIRDFLFRETVAAHTLSFQDLFLGKFGGRPDWARVDRAEALAFELMKVVPAGQRAPMLTLMGWLEWLKGYGSQADRYLKLAAEDVEGFRLAELMRELIGRGSIAEVVRNPATAYRRNDI